MTRQIALVCCEQPQVLPSFEGPARLFGWERKLLGTPMRTAYVREVALTVAGRAVMLARTVASQRDPATAALRRLQRKPLAELLFTDTSWSRIGAPLPLLAMPQWSAPRQAAMPTRACLWCNRASRSQLLVEEYFLDELIRQNMPRHR